MGADLIDCFHVLGYEFDVAARSSMARRLLRSLYSRVRCPHQHVRAPLFELTLCTAFEGPAWRVTLDGRCLAERGTLDAALRHLEYEICTRIIAHRSDLVVLHGATVVGNGGSTFIAGQSGAGKTTLALALVAGGWRVAGDDVALLDPSTGLLWPVPRCAHLDARSQSLLRRVGLRLPAQASRHGFVTPADLGMDCYAPVSVQHLLLLSRGENGIPTVSRVSDAEALLWLLSEAGWPGHAPTAAIAALGRLVGSASCHRIMRGSLETTVGAVAALIGDGRRE